jgi:murein DD-endopeptidase MepM/ murein hydrolase activator NlpD
VAQRQDAWAASGVAGACAAVVATALAVSVAAVPTAHADPVARTAQAASAGRPDIAALQVALRARGLYSATIDGIRGPLTRDGVRRFQARRGLVVDGIAGPRTRAALGWRGRPGLGSRTIRAGARGWDVAALQFLLATRGFASGAFDGVLGPRGDSALRRFQAWAGLAADGLAGPATVSAVRRPPARSPLRFLAPIGGTPADGFGPRGDRMHTGLDYPAAAGAGVVAAGRGCVQSASFDPGGYGNLVVIGHRAGMTSWYAHLARFSVRPGQCVVAGTPIGAVGATGNATGPHLHFELRLRGAAIDPLTGL